MERKRFLSLFLSLSSLIIFVGGTSVMGQIPGQLAQDFLAGDVPSADEVIALEKEAAANANDLRLTRKLGKGYFFQFFGGGDVSAIPKAEKTLDRALKLQKDDAESIVYLGALQIIRAMRLEKQDAVKQKASFDRGFELVKQAEKIDPRHGAVVSIASASYLWLPDSYGMAPHVVEMLEGMRKGMGPMFKKFSHHGQQRLLLTLGQAYVRTGQNEKAKVAFDEALQVSDASKEAGLIKAELAKLKS